MRIKLPVLSVAVSEGHIFALLKEENNLLSLVSLNRRLEVEDKLAVLKGSSGFLLDVWKDSILFAVNDELIALREGGLKHVLKAHLPTNTFWHATRVGDFVYVQEYGVSPTGIFVLTRDYENPRLLITNKELDKGSKHFHNIVYDRFRGWLIATLGDGNMVRAAVSVDGGENWHPLYKGPWQFVPVVPLKDMIVFGMDSGIARGGIGIYYPNEERWQFIFLKLLDKRVKQAQVCDLKLLNNGLWIGALGTPQAIVASKDLRRWYALHVESFNNWFNHQMRICEGGDFIVCCTGKSILLFKKNDLYDLIRGTNYLMVTYKAYVDRLKGLAFTIKRNFKSKVKKYFSKKRR